jgi:hypothetical protein
LIFTVLMRAAAAEEVHLLGKIHKKTQTIGGLGLLEERRCAFKWGSECTM